MPQQTGPLANQGSRLCNTPIRLEPAINHQQTDQSSQPPNCEHHARTRRDKLPRRPSDARHPQICFKPTLPTFPNHEPETFQIKTKLTETRAPPFGQSTGNPRHETTPPTGNPRIGQDLDTSQSTNDSRPSNKHPRTFPIDERKRAIRNQDNIKSTRTHNEKSSKRIKMHDASKSTSDSKRSNRTSTTHYNR